MKKYRRLTLVLLSVIMIAGCNRLDFKKTKGGMPYILFPGNGKKKAITGSVLKVSIVQLLNDSVRFDSRKSLPVGISISDFGRTYDPAELFNSLHDGDSLIT